MDRYVELLYQFVQYIMQIATLAAPLAILIFAGFAGVKVADKLGELFIDDNIRRRRLKKIGSNATRDEMLHIISTLRPKEFEYYVADLLVKNGYTAKVVGGHGKGDGGIDVVAKKGGKLVYVQCKKFIGKDIGVAMVRDFYGAIADSVHKSGARGVFITTSYFTEDAKKFAAGKKLRLYDGNDLVDLVFARELQGESISTGDKLRSEILRNTAPICPACTKQLAVRKGESAFLGCTGYPECRYTYSLELRR